MYRQECIPVGCVPPARRPYLPGPGGGGGCVPGPWGGGCTWPRGVYLVRGYLVPGGCTWSWGVGGIPGPGGGCTWSPGGVPGPGGCTWSRGVYLVPGGVYLVLGGTWSWGGTWSRGVPGPEGVPGQVPPPLWTESQTPVKT